MWDKMPPLKKEKNPQEFAVFDAGEVLQRLFFRGCQLATGALLLYQQNALPEQIDETLLPAQFLDRLLETGDLATSDAEDFKELVVEALRFSSFVAGGIGAYLVPTESACYVHSGGIRHRSPCFLRFGSAKYRYQHIRVGIPLVGFRPPYPGRRTKHN